MTNTTEPEGSKRDDTKVLSNESISIVTVYSPHEANTYLLDEYLENPTKAKVLKHLKYDRSPVVRMKDVIAKEEHNE